ncbi:hypothetical protein O3G_MSEX012015 [Manduca sexta]|uniref:Uncharacterized protein n=1 Tax=Manduca sexta TaxID=7130 RepID=A0A921ZMM9_MANSE|nr:hypothetical protein O3G_MSEX012015 [Manduca sexta]
MAFKVSNQCNDGQTSKEGWSLDTTACRASTSRGLSHSSGDYDEDKYSYFSDKCSCDSGSVEYLKRPCTIADSSIKLHKSKWSILKQYFKCYVRRKKKHINKQKGSQKTCAEKAK